MSTEDRYAVCERRSDGTVVRLGRVALTASAAQAGYAAELREGVGSPLRLSTATRRALASARERMQARDRERARQRELRERRARHERVGLAAWAAAQEW